MSDPKFQPGDEELVDCSLCGKPTREYCSTLACGDCHKSLTLDDCLAGSAEADRRMNHPTRAEAASDRGWVERQHERRAKRAERRSQT